MEKYTCISCGRKIRKDLIPEGYPTISEELIDCPWCNGADEEPQIGHSDSACELTGGVRFIL